jgi:uncharacterized RDD family membrane protein YckC
MMQDPLAVRPSDAVAELAADLATRRRGLWPRAAMRLLEVAILLMRVVAILVLLSPLLGLAILLL